MSKLAPLSQSRCLSFFLLLFSFSLPPQAQEGLMTDPGVSAGSSFSSMESCAMAARKVTITLTSRIVGSYEARSYPDDDRDNNGLWELYKVPVYEILVAGTDDAGTATTYKHQAPRFMPYFNDPAKPDPHYSSRGWLNAGLSAKR